MPCVHGIKRNGDEKLVTTGRNQIWFCDGCGTAFLWDEASSIYGSEKDIENHDFNRTWIACSNDCMREKPADFPKGKFRSKKTRV